VKNIKDLNVKRHLGRKCKNATPLKTRFQTAWSGATGVVGWCEATDHNPVNRVNSDRADAESG
jgi:hypothetical protein